MLHHSPTLDKIIYVSTSTSDHNELVEKIMFKNIIQSIVSLAYIIELKVRVIHCSTFISHLCLLHTYYKKIYNLAC